jgi:hypothetical protein
MITGVDAKTETADGRKPEQKPSVAVAAETVKKTLKKLSASDLKRWHELQRKEKKDYGTVMQKASKKVKQEPSDADSASSNTNQEQEERDICLKRDGENVQELEAQDAVVKHNDTEKVDKKGSSCKPGRNRKASNVRVKNVSKVNVKSSNVPSKAEKSSSDVKVDEDKAGNRKRRSCAKKVNYVESSDGEDETGIPAKKISAKKPANKSKKKTKRRGSAKSKMR